MLILTVLYRRKNCKKKKSLQAAKQKSKRNKPPFLRIVNFFNYENSYRIISLKVFRNFLHSKISHPLKWRWRRIFFTQRNLNPVRKSRKYQFTRYPLTILNKYPKQPIHPIIRAKRKKPLDRRKNYGKNNLISSFRKSASECTFPTTVERSINTHRSTNGERQRERETRVITVQETEARGEKFGARFELRAARSIRKFNLRRGKKRHQISYIVAGTIVAGPIRNL